jgi:two-component system, LytTR family, sensor kinase
LVKSQLNPHFLFNTIHNIDVLIEKDASKASSYLNKLSDIMRFMLYETKPSKIPLIKEWAYLEKYIELQKIRISNSKSVQYSWQGEVENVMIAPMLLIPFVENAFKHAEGVKSDDAIVIGLKVEKNCIYFDCKNRFLSKNKENEEYGGLGNDLINKRLQLLYGKKHELKISENENFYQVNLTLFL